jgi:PAS domain S-box-containing protein
MVSCKKALSLFFTILLTLSLPGFTQNIRNLNSLTGKKDIPANCMLQLAGGELLIGTSSGLVEYNGAQSKVYTTADGLASNEVTAIFLASDSTCWIGHKNGMVTLMKAEKLSAFPYNNQLPHKPVTAFCEASGTWIASYGGGVAYCAGNRLVQYTQDNGLSDNTVYTLCSDKSGNVWAGTDEGISKLLIRNGKILFSRISMSEGLPDNIVRCLLFHGENELYVAMQDSGICRYDISSNRFTTPVHSWKYGAITSLCEDKEGVLLAGTEEHGFIRYTLSGPKQFIRVTDKRHGLPLNGINAVFADRENNVWLGTDKGVTELCRGKVSFIPLKGDGFSDRISAIRIDRNGNYWLGTDAGLEEYCYLPDGQTVTKIWFPAAGQPEKQITCVFEDHNGMIWAGTFGSGLYCLDPVSGRTEQVSAKDGIAGNTISCITEDSRGNLWIATLGGGISRISYAANKRTIKNYSLKEGLNADYIYSLFPGSQGDLWIGSDGDGLIRFRNEEFSEEHTGKGAATVYAVREDADHATWYSVAGEGLYRYDGRSFIQYSTDKGLRDNDPPIMEVAGDNVVVVHPKGIDVLNRKSGKFSYFPVPGDEIDPNMNASFCDREGNVWIGTNKGVLCFRPDDVLSDTIAPLAKLTGLVVQYQAYAPDSISAFRYAQNNFTFGFSAVWMQPDDKVRFRYKLEGIDTAFSETENGTVNYSSLPAGKYTFLVSAAGSNGRWSQPARYQFSIAAPVWQTVWFWLLLACSAGALMYLLFHYRLRVLKREKLVLEHKVSQRTEEIVKQAKLIETKNRELERLSIVARETGNVIIIMDAEGKLEWINDSFQRLNNITLDELKKKKGETIFDVSNNPEIRSIVQRCITERRSVVYESRNELGNGEYVWESSTLTPIYNDKGELQKLIIIDTDVTERKRDEETIRQKNKDITDSINYAKRIQNSILPGMDLVRNALPDSFIFYMQKDIVSGDFYWFAEKEEHVVIAAVDCTGHGVPGAFMSLIGYNLLNQIVNEKNILDPGEILTELNRQVLKVLYKNNPDDTYNDGMDASVCTINRKTKELLFSGAMRPMYLFGKEGFREIKGDKISIGTREEDAQRRIRFTTHLLEAGEGDVFYMSSDGYADQFGGRKGEKLMTKNFKNILSKIHHLPFDEQHHLVMDYHKQWKGDFEQVDDILVIGFSI